MAAVVEDLRVEDPSPVEEVEESAEDIALMLKIEQEAEESERIRLEAHKMLEDRLKNVDDRKAIEKDTIDSILNRHAIGGFEIKPRGEKVKGFRKQEEFGAKMRIKP